MKADVAIIGCGIAGLKCAEQLSRAGLTSLIVERAPLPGGHVGLFSCKATDRCQRCGACLLEDLREHVLLSTEVDMLLRTTVSAVARTDRGFRLDLLQYDSPVRTDEGSTVEYETEDLALELANPGSKVRDPGDTHRRPPEEITADARAIVLACGFTAFNPSEKLRLGYGHVPGVVTSLELDTLMRTGNFADRFAADTINSLAFIQCVGSRDPKVGRNYCSRVCCGNALRLARLMKHRFPGIEPAMFYMDIQNYDRHFERRLAEASQEVRLIRAMPSHIESSPDGKPTVIYQDSDNRRASASFDIVVLSVGISPVAGSPDLAEMLDLETNEDGFFGPISEYSQPDLPGVFFAGTIQGPKSIEQTIHGAVRTSADVAAYVRSADFGVNA